ncbi:Thioredoxin [subsurface metagenome]
MSELTLTEQNFEEEVIKSNQLVLVDFWSPTCPPCLILGPIIEEVAKEFESRAKVGKLNVAENPKIARDYQIMGIPTLIIFKDGKPIERATGLRSKQVLINKLNSLL